MGKPVLSVVMPVHGGGAWLDAALASIPDAADGDVEVLVLDSTSSGPCRDAVDRHARRLRIDYAWMPATPSWTAKTNLGVERARADHVCTLHQDDCWLPGRLEGFLSERSRYPDATLFLGPSRIVDGSGRDLGPWQLPVPFGPVAEDVLRSALLVQNSIAIPAPVVRRDAWLAVGGLDEALWYAADWDLWLKLAAHGTAIHHPRPATAFRVHGNSLTMSGDRGEMATELERVLARHMPPGCREERVCRTSVKVNVLLARAVSGSPFSALKAIAAILALGPRGAVRYLHASRFAERILPRLRARFAGVF
ncbi:glycosyltransferase [Tsuneonella amylolytica]|uniref:glycosyltransferase n=1 Tax=Tsuneonella amylolytica TaxID=2338327 RepID=UPI000EA9C20C|nr:glycosyltransferase [Tsuneonella amylolytica]